MSTTTIASIQAALTPIADKIGQGAEYVWGVVVRQQIAIGIGDFVWSALFLVAAIALAFVSARVIKQEKLKSGYSDGGWVIFGVVIAIVALISLALCFGFATDGVMRLLNPDFYAIQFFTDIVTHSSN